MNTFLIQDATRLEIDSRNKLIALVNNEVKAANLGFVGSNSGFCKEIILGMLICAFQSKSILSEPQNKSIIALYNKIM